MSVVLWLNAAGDDDSDSPGQPRYGAQDLRQPMAMWLWPGVDELLGARSGVRPDAINAVTLSGGRAEVAEFTAVVNTRSSLVVGPYVVAIQAHAHLIPAVDDLPRRDLIVLRVLDDDEDGSAERTAVTEYITGEPAAEPQSPTVPAGTLRLVTLQTEPGEGTRVLRGATPTVASGGVLPVLQAADLPKVGIYPGATGWVQQADTLMAVTADRAWEAIASPAAHAAAAGLAGMVDDYVDDPVIASSSEFAALDGGPRVSVEIGAGGRARVDWAARYEFLSAADTRLARMRIRMSGVNTGTVGSNNAWSARNAPPRSTSEGWTQSKTAWRIISGLKPGRTTFTAEYAASTDRCRFDERALAVTPLPAAAD